MCIKIDLHIHSVCSDGLLTPTQIVHDAKEKGLQLVALTDHDTLDGIPEFLAAAQDVNLPALHGIEFTSQMNGRDLHLLAYNFRLDDPGILGLVHNFSELQALFNLQRICNFEKNFGKTIDLSQIPDHSNLTPIRLAYWLFETGQISEAEFPERIGDIFPLFERDSAEFEMNYAPHLPLAENVVQIVQKAGGFAVLAHPQSMAVTFTEVLRLYGQGLRGLEVFYPKQSPEPYLSWAAQLALGVTAGTDFHGVLDRNERSIGFLLDPSLPGRAYFYTGDQTL